MVESKRQNDIDAYAQFEKWLGEQPYWLQDATYRIYHGQNIDQEQIVGYSAMCVAQAKKMPVDYKKLSQNGSRKQSATSRLSVLNLSEIVGVNALAQDAALSFSETGITVVYGLNGAGKSGFMRIFKVLSGNPYKEDIQPNVFKKESSIIPSCKFSIVEDGNESELSCELDTKSKDTPLLNCDVFDTRISNDYITKSNNVSYQPFVFTVLAELSKVADRISKYITSQIKAIPTSSIDIPPEFQASDGIEWIQQLSSDSVFPPQYSVWSEEHQALLEKLPKMLDTEIIQSKLQLDSSRLSAIKPVLDDLIAANKAIQSVDLIDAFESYRASERQLAAAEALFAENADVSDKLSIYSSDWKELWRAAQRYYEGTFFTDCAKHFGEEGSICPLCHQIISGDIVSRFKSVNEYVNGACSEEYKKAIDTLKKYLRAIVERTYSFNQIVPQLSAILDEKELAIIQNAYFVIGVDREFDDIEAEYNRVRNINLKAAINLLLEKQKDFKRSCDDLERSLKDEGHALLQEQLFDLKYHKWVYDNQTAIETIIANAKKTQELKNARSLLTTNKITYESNFLADRLITDAYIERFEYELSVLTKKLKVKLEKAPSQKGSTPYKVSIDTAAGIRCKPEDILSEGEQRIVALAAFFADATGRRIRTPMIIDDPISSLDYNYEDAATKRIVEIAKQRQVIVFTHRISLLVGLKDLCEEKSVKFTENRIRSAVKGKGVPDFEGSYYGKIPTQINELIHRIDQIKVKDPDSEEYIDAIGRTCQQFRICVERTVEDELIFGVVKRFRRKIMTNGLIKKLPAISKEDCEMIDSMMTKYSFMEHSQPAETPSVYYELDEIRADVQAFSDWLSSFRRRTKNM